MNNEQKIIKRASSEILLSVLILLFLSQAFSQESDFKKGEPIQGGAGQKQEGVSTKQKNEGVKSSGELGKVEKPRWEEVLRSFEVLKGKTPLLSSTNSQDLKNQNLMRDMVMASSANLDELEQKMLNSQSFERGAWDNETVRTQIFEVFQWALLRARLKLEAGDFAGTQKIWGAWFRGAADWPFEEATIEGMLSSVKIRSQLLDEVENSYLKFAENQSHQKTLGSFTDFKKWFLGLSYTWPMDRIIIAESHKNLSSLFWPMADKVAKKFQKNPYQTAAEMLKKEKGTDSRGALKIKSFWTEKEIILFRTELTRVSKLKLRIAVKEFEIKNQKMPMSPQEIIKGGFLDQVPIDYFSGRPLDLTSL